MFLGQLDDVNPNAHPSEILRRQQKIPFKMEDNPMCKLIYKMEGDLMHETLYKIEDHLALKIMSKTEGDLMHKTVYQIEDHLVLKIMSKTKEDLMLKTMHKMEDDLVKQETGPHHNALHDCYFQRFLSDLNTQDQYLT